MTEKERAIVSPKDKNNQSVLEKFLSMGIELPEGVSSEHVGIPIYLPHGWRSERHGSFWTHYYDGNDCLMFSVFWKKGYRNWLDIEHFTTFPIE